MDGNKPFLENENQDSDDSQQSCLSDLKFLKFVDGNLSENEYQAVLSHLNTCHKCLETLAFIGKVSPQTFAPSKNTAKMNPDSKSQQKQVDLILQYIKKDQEKSAHKTPTENLSSKPSNLLPATNYLPKIKFKPVTSFFKEFTNLEIQLTKYLTMGKFATTVVAIASFLIVIVAGGGYFYYRTNNPELKFENIVDDFSIYFKDGKLSGPIGMRRIPVLLNFSDSDSAKIANASQYAKAIIESREVSTNFLQNYLKLLIISENYSSADSLYHEIHKTTTISETLLNDIGVLYFQKEKQKNLPDYAMAEAAFQEAIELNPKFKDAFFNLALVMIEKSNTERAKELLKKYLELENTDKDEIWLPAAKALERELESVQN